MYNDSTFAVLFFFIMWLAVVGGSITPIFGVGATNIGPTDFCINSRLENYVSAACIVPLVNDTLIFIATSWRLWKNAYVDQSIHNNIQVMVFGRHLPSFSRALLKDGQAYYLTTISLNLITVSLFFNRSIPVVYRSFIGIPNIVLMNSMACHVYRNVRFGVYVENASTITTISTRHDRKTESAIVFGANKALHAYGASTSGEQTTTLDMELDRISRASMQKSPSTSTPDS